MEKQQAIEFIKSILTSKFDYENFEVLVKNLLNDYEIKDQKFSGSRIPEKFQDHISAYRRIGKYEDPEGDLLDILVVQTKSVSKLEKTRTTLRNFVVHHLKNFDKQFALVAFYSNEDEGSDWRLSIVKIDFESVKDISGKIKIKEDWVPAKRYSYLVGENENAHTAQKQLLPLLCNDHSKPIIVKEADGDGSIEGAFSIETVTDEFYEQYKELYLNIIENKNIVNSLKNTNISPSRFVKKLLGQIVFLYFIQKKGWLGVDKDSKMGQGSKRFLQNKFDSINKTGKNYYNDFLSTLFYSALAKEHNDCGIKYFFNELNCRVPFLNGGLFEADFDWKTANLKLPNELFKNKIKNRTGDLGTGILDVFDRYNFTIKEDEPLEKEVAIDPEMLGKVFENMLEIKERKSKGAYYTPREVVHYMCQDSIIKFLDNKINSYSKTYNTLDSDQFSFLKGQSNKKGELKLETEDVDIRIPKEDIEFFIRKSHYLIENEKNVNKKKNETKTYYYKIPQSIRENANLLDSILSSIKVCDPAVGSGAFPVGMLHEIVLARTVLNLIVNDNFNSTYFLKRHTIQQSLYGVDIDESAIDIARLRLWLSLIVDEEDYDEIEPLPNLDYKFVKGNSIIGFPENWKSPAFEKFEKLKLKYFNETNQERKNQLKKEIDVEIAKRLSSSKRIFGYEIDFDFKIYFSEVWHYNKGFDIVIGNPPYIDIKQLEANFVKFLFNHYQTTQNRINLYSIFIEKAFKIGNKFSTVNFINPNSMLLNSSYKKLRNLIIGNVTKILKLPDKIFKKAIVETIILQLSQKINSELIEGKFYKNDAYLNFENIQYSLFNRDSWLKDSELRMNIFRTPEQTKALMYIEKNKEILKRKFDFCLGITPYDKYKGHTPEEIKSRVFHSKVKINDEYVPLISGSNVKKYFVDGRIIKEYLRYGDWLGAPRQKKFFISKRVIVRQIVSGQNLSIIAGYSEEELYHTQIGFSIIENDTSPFSPRILASLLNSDVISFYHKYKYLDIEKNTFQKILIENCKELPCPSLEIKEQIIIEEVASYLEFLGLQGNQEIVYSFFKDLLNSIFYEVFFRELVIAADKKIIKYLEDITKLKTSYSIEKKNAIIVDQFNKYYNPEHPVRNNIETLNSISLIQTIKEAMIEN